MDVLSNPLGIGLSLVAAAGVGLWSLRRWVFPELSLNDIPAEGGTPADRAERAVEDLQFQLEVAEELAPDPAILNQLSSQVAMATEDAEQLRRYAEAEAARQPERSVIVPAVIEIPLTPP